MGTAQLSRTHVSYMLPRDEIVVSIDPVIENMVYISHHLQHGDQRSKRSCLQSCRLILAVLAFNSYLP